MKANPILSRLLVVTVCCVGWGAGGAQLRIAVVPTAPALNTVADLLATTLSQGDVVVLDRTESRRIFEERATEGSGALSLAAADGLVVLDLGRDASQRVLSTRLVSVRTGIVFAEHKHPWELQDPVDWSGKMAKRLIAVAPKLLVPATDLVGLSLLNLRSAAISSRAEKMEIELTRLLRNRLMREAQVHLLERRRMEVLLEETHWFDHRNERFVAAGWVVDGLIDREGFSESQATVDLHIASPGNAAGQQLRVTGVRTNLPGLAETLAVRLMEALKRTPGATQIDPATEALRQWEEAKWAWKWKVIRSAQAAGDSAWALGMRTPEVMDLRIRAWQETGRDPVGPVLDRSIVVFGPADAGRFAELRRAVSLFEQGGALFASVSNTPTVSQSELGLRLIQDLTHWLAHYYYTPEARDGQEEAISEAKQQVARVWAHLAGIEQRSGSTTNTALWLAKANGAPFWGDTPEDGVRICKEILHAGMFPSVRHNFIGRFPVEHFITSRQNVPLVKFFPLGGWKWADRRRGTAVWKSFEQQLCASANPLERLEGFYLRCCSSRTSGEYTNAAQDLLNFTWTNRLAILNGGLCPKLLEDLHLLLGTPKPDRLTGASRDANFSQQTWVPFEEKMKGWMRLSAAWVFLSGTNLQQYTRAPNPWPARWTKEDAKELLPLVQQALAKTPSDREHEERRLGLKAFEAALGNIISPPPPLSANARMGFEMWPEDPEKVAERLVLTNFLNGIRLWSPDDSVAPEGSLRSFKLLNMFERDGAIWAGMRYQVGEHSISDHLVLARIDPQTLKTDYFRTEGRQAQIHGNAFEIHQGFIYLATSKGIERLSISTGRWEAVSSDISVPFAFSLAAGRLFVNGGSSIHELNPDRTTRLIASTRRSPPESEFDKVRDYKFAALAQCGDDKLWTWADRNVWVADKAGSWSLLTSLGADDGPIISSCAILGMNGLEIWRVLPGTNAAECVYRQPTRTDSFTKRASTLWQTMPWLGVRGAAVCADRTELWIYSGIFAVESKAKQPCLHLWNGRSGIIVALGNETRIPAPIPVHLELPNTAVLRALLPRLSGRCYSETFFKKGSSVFVLAQSSIPCLWLISAEALQKAAGQAVAAVAQSSNEIPQGSSMPGRRSVSEVPSRPSAQK